MLELPASPGYEPLLVAYGYHPILARGMATLAIRQARRRARESSWQRPVFDAIRFLARQRRQKRAIVPRAELLLRAWEETSLVETLFDETGLSEGEFISLLKSVVNRQDFDFDRITALAASVAPRVALSRGPKISAPSAAHEFLLRHWVAPAARHRRSSRRNRAQEYVDALTEATQREFRNSDFDSRPARRRLRAQRRESDHNPSNVVAPRGENRRN